MTREGRLDRVTLKIGSGYRYNERALLDELRAGLLFRPRRRKASR
jgi:hypothetical protein